MGPPHHEVGEDSNPHNRAQEGDHKEFLGFLLDKVSDVKTKHSFEAFKTPQVISEMRLDLYLVANIWNREPQREDYGQQEEVGGLFTSCIRPL